MSCIILLIFQYKLNDLLSKDRRYSAETVHQQYNNFISESETNRERKEQAESTKYINKSMLMY